MQTLLRTAAIVLVVAAPLTVWAIAVHFVRMPRDFENIAGRGQALERLEQAIKRREEARSQAVQDLLSQRRTLAETLKHFQELNRQWPDLSAMARVAGVKEPDEEIAFQLILRHVELALSGRSEELAVVLRRLEKDYQQLQNGR